MGVNSAYFTCSIIKAGNTISNYTTATVFLTLPKNFVGSLDAFVTNGYFRLISEDDYKNTTTTIINENVIGELVLPNFLSEKVTLLPIPMEHSKILLK